MKLQTLFSLWLLFPIQQVMAQPLEVETNFTGIFDNREYTREFNNEKETIAGSQLNFEIGPPSINMHTFRAGINYFYEFGSELLELKPKPILYYSYGNEMNRFVFGSFSRNDIPHFPVAILSEKFMYYYPTVEGILLQRKIGRYDISLFADWMSRQNEIRREQFMTAIVAQARPGNWIFETFFYQFHNGRRTVPSRIDYIDDYFGGVDLVGYDFADWTGLNRAEIKTGILTSSHRDRLVSRVHTINYSSYSEIILESHGFGAEVFLKFGGLHQLAFGDEFYTTANNYVRTNLYYIPFKTTQVEARITWSLHTYNGLLDHQQLFQLVYTID